MYLDNDGEKMRINPINNRNAVTFGYDKNLDGKVKATLSQKDTPLNLALLNLNDFCNKTEDLIDEGKKKGILGADGFPMMNLLLSAKILLANNLTTYFPNLNYVETEVKHYAKESESRARSWKMDLVDQIVSVFPPEDKNAPVNNVDLVSPQTNLMNKKPPFKVKGFDYTDNIK